MLKAAALSAAFLFMNISEKIEIISSRRRFGMKPGLDRMQALLAALGNPERELLSIHIAGTNGKGSVAAMLSSILSAADIGKIGRFTSPHLVYFNERITINNAPVSNEILSPALDRLLTALDKLDKEDKYATFFECATALAFDIFRTQGVRLVVIETGLGGRLDATNVITPLLSIITNIGLEHCEYLGDTIEAIALEKAGIIKPTRPVVLGEMKTEAHSAIRSYAQRQSSPLYEGEVSITTRKDKTGKTVLSIETENLSISSVRFALDGAYQLENLATAIKAIDAFTQYTGIEITQKAIKTGLEMVSWPCRYQEVSCDPTVIIDGAHNPSAAKALASALEKRKEPLILVAGFCTDKDILTSLQILKPYFKEAIATESPSPRAMASSELSTLMTQAGIRNSTALPDWKKAMAMACKWAKEKNGTVIVAGSLFLAGAVADYFNALPWQGGIKVENEALKTQ